MNLRDITQPLSTKEAVNEMLKRGDIVKEESKGVAYWIYVLFVVAIWFAIGWIAISRI